MRVIPYGRQWIDDDDLSAVKEALNSDYLTTGPAVEAFEKALASKVDAKYAVVCSSATAALHLASIAVGITTNHWVIVPAITFVATANAVRFQGANILFVDVNKSTGLLEKHHVKSLLDENRDKNISAIFPVHLNGQSVDMKSISEIAQEFGLKVIEDGCHAIGTSMQGENNRQYKVGSCDYSDACVFSFHPVKTITMGEGGAITTNDEDIYNNLLLHRNHGMTRDMEQFKNSDHIFDSKDKQEPWYYEMQSLGYNYRASDINCALGLSQLNKLDKFAIKRIELTKYYDKELKQFEEYIQPIAKVEKSNSVLHIYAVHIDFDELNISRVELIKELMKNNIFTQVHYIPVCNQPYYVSLYGENNLPGAEYYYKHVLSLPLFPAMTLEDIDYIIATLKKILINS